MERLTANWKWMLTIAIPIVVAILVFLPGHPHVYAAPQNEGVTSVPYGVPDHSKPSPFPAIVMKHLRRAPAAPPPAPGPQDSPEPVAQP